MSSGDILIIGGCGEVGRRLVEMLDRSYEDRIVIASRDPECDDHRVKRVDVDDPRSVDAALDGADAVVVCVRQREPYVLRAAVRRGIAYTSIAPPWIPWPSLAPLREQATRTGARVVLATGLEPGISSVLARIAADELHSVESIETAVLLGVGDDYGADSLAFIMDELAQPYTIVERGREQPMHAFASSAMIAFPPPIGARRAYTMPFRDQLYYPATLGAKTAIARIALDPPWVGTALAKLTTIGGAGMRSGHRARKAMHDLAERMRHRYLERDRYALVVEVTSARGRMRATLMGRRQAHATAAGAAAYVEALLEDELAPGVWLGEQVIEPKRFLARLAAHAIVPIIEYPRRALHAV